MKLTDSREEAVCHRAGPCVVIAGPGSGKTYTITNRIKYLIEKMNVKPGEILTVTFNKAAAVEMEARFKNSINKSKNNINYNGVRFGTFHGIFFYILKKAYGFNASNIISEEEKFNKIKEYVMEENVETEDMNEFVSSIINEFGIVVSDMININNYYSSTCGRDVFIKIYNRYNDYLCNNNLIDFDDMMMLCYELLTKREDILNMWRRIFKYILVDEFQDINKIQYEIIKLLAAPLNNLFVVGDDDQAIYSFRGARPSIMLNFKEDYKDAKMIRLKENFRCSEKIIDASSKLISKNKKRFPKEIEGVNKEKSFLSIMSFKDVNDECNYITDYIKKMKNDGIELKSLAILYRTNLEPRLLISKLMENNISFMMKDKLPNIYEHFIAKDIISYIKFSLGETKREHFLRIMNKPNRYISRKIINSEEISLFKLKQDNINKSWFVKNIDKLKYNLSILKNLSPKEGISYIRKVIGYDEFIETYAIEKNINKEELISVIEEIEEESKNFKNYDEWFEHIDNYSEELKKIKRNELMDDYVVLGTMHSAKGLEFDKVFIIDAIEGITPYSKASIPEDIEEERRLFYVAMTRAKYVLKILYPEKRYNKNTKVSRFINEIKC